MLENQFGIARIFFHGVPESIDLNLVHKDEKKDMDNNYNYDLMVFMREMQAQIRKDMK